jgi:hypothetical protein
MLMALVVLVVGITAPGYGDDDHGDGKNHDVGKFLRLSGPHIDGTLTLIQVGADAIVTFSSGIGTCQGIFITQTIFGFTVPTTAKSLEGYLLPVADTSSFYPMTPGASSPCLRKDQKVGDPIVLVVVDAPKFCRNGVQCPNEITAEVVLLQVVQRSHKDKDEGKDKDK